MDSAAAALQELNDGLPVNLVLADELMPGGVQRIRDIEARKNDRGRLPIIALTASPDDPRNRRGNA